MAVSLFAVEAVQMPRLGVGTRAFNYKPFGTNEKFFMVLSSDIPACCISNLRDTRCKVRRPHTKSLILKLTEIKSLITRSFQKLCNT